jgi:hypothetical protein
MTRPGWIAVAALAVMFAGCGAAPDSGYGGASASAAVSATSETSIGGSPTPPESMAAATEPAWSPLPPDRMLLGAAVRIAVPELNLREGPRLSAPKLDVLTPNDVLWLGISAPQGGPIEADGYTWYHGIAISNDSALPPLPQMLIGEGDAPQGWVAVGKGDSAYVTRLAPRCPSSPDFASVSFQLPAERLECFGSRPIVLEGTLGCDGCAPLPDGYEPVWLADPETGGLLSANVGETRGKLHLRYAPDGPTPPAAGSIVRVTGHFDDPAAQTCRMSVSPLFGMGAASAVPLDPAVAILICRQEFVVDAFQVLGMDPSFTTE